MSRAKEANREGWVFGQGGIGTALGSSRQSIINWAEKFGVRTKANPNGTPPAVEGWYEVADWQRFVETNQLGRKELRLRGLSMESSPPPQTMGEGGAREEAANGGGASAQTLMQLRCETEKEKIAKMRTHREIEEGTLLREPELAVATGATLAHFGGALARFPDFVARLLAYKNDEVISATLGDELRGILLELTENETLDSFARGEAFDAESPEVEIPPGIEERTFRNALTVEIQKMFRKIGEPICRRAHSKVPEGGPWNKFGMPHFDDNDDEPRKPLTDDDRFSPSQLKRNREEEEKKREKDNKPARRAARKIH